MNRLISLSFVVLGLGATSAILAQTVGGLDVGAIEGRDPAIAENAENLVKQALIRGKTAVESASAAVTSSEANLRRAPLGTAGGAQGPVDFDAILAGAKGNLTTPRGGPMLVAFASLSMPEASLKRVIGDVTQAGGVIVFRGFPSGSAARFALAMRKLVEPRQAASVLIDPRLFRAFGVEAVPTYVAVSSDYVPCDSLTCVSDVPPFDRLVGNVPARFALETIAGARGPGAPVAEVALARLGSAQ
ncbi:MAG: type-F conjugative transfer system pilin assembly protein TrbC [Novosphingobium sp.]|nr:type-F conjugative transfer system pilin assembly protein TrbC [Novosphingobium sp.]